LGLALRPKDKSNSRQCIALRTFSVGGGVIPYKYPLSKAWQNNSTCFSVALSELKPVSYVKRRQKRIIKKY
jgi:hypothetical protein